MQEAAVKAFFQTNSLMAFSSLLIIGIIGGRLAHYSRVVPRITGYIVAGFILGPNAAGMLTFDLLDKAQVFSNLAVSLILFELGTHVDFKWLADKLSLVRMGLLECALSFLLVLICLLLFKLSLFNALLIAAIGVSSSPAITMLIAEEYDAKGLIIQKSLFLTAFNNLIAFVLYTVIIFFFQFTLPDHSKPVLSYLMPFYTLFGSILLALVLSVALIGLGRFLGKHENSQFGALIGVLILANGVASALQLSPILTSLMFGVITVNLDWKQYLLEVEFGHSSEVFFVILFVFAGAHLQLSSLFDIGMLAIAFILARFVGKLLPILWVHRKEKISTVRSTALAVTLLPMAGTAIGFLSRLVYLSPRTVQLISTIVIASIAVLETIGPILTLLSLKITGEINGKSKTSLTTS